MVSLIFGLVLAQTPAPGAEPSERTLASAIRTVDAEISRLDEGDWRPIPAPLRRPAPGGASRIASAAKSLAALVPAQTAHHDAAEGAWWQVAIAVAEAHSDGPLVIQLASTAAMRWPAVPDFRLAHARGLSLGSNPSPHRTALRMFEALADKRDHSSIAAEAIVRRSLLLWRLDQRQEAHAGLIGLVQLPLPSRHADRRQRYVAYVVLALMADAADDRAAARHWFDAAYDCEPAWQSAAIAVAADRMMDGRDSAGAIATAQFATPSADDPWRLYAYGDFARLTDLRSVLAARWRELQGVR